MFAQTTHVDAAICGLACWVVFGKFQVSSKSVFEMLGVENCHFLYLRPVAFITACTSVQAVIDSMSVGHLVDILLIVYNSTEHVTQKSPGPKCGWVGRILRPDSCMSGSSWSKEPLWSIWSVGVLPWQPLPHCPSQWHGSLPRLWFTQFLHCKHTMPAFTP